MPVDPMTRSILHYRPGQAMACPECGHSQWHVGRHSAECAWCATALPIATAGCRYRPALSLDKARAA